MKIEKYNEFLDNKISISNDIIRLIEDAESTPISDPVAISERKQYRKVIEIGQSVIPFLIERKLYLWNIGLKELTGVEPKGENSNEIVNFWSKWLDENGKI